MKAYDALTPVCQFNTLAGFPQEYRHIEDDSVQFQMNQIIQEEFDELLDAFQAVNRGEVIDGAGDLIVTAAGLLHRMGLDPNDVMAAINASNQSKFCHTAHDAYESVCQYDDDPRYHSVKAELVDDLYYVIYGKKPGSDSWKILKGINYFEPDFSALKGFKDQPQKRGV